ncbi:hypothetical protein ATO3_04845 [Marinibacterium profundimaris]|uniref:Uncharacterized protein n=2 Tax=Marinibacterium profundimaris TaxID=1679460 RepID=A0A225NT07_9RHOB|nr:hypothetical protein ATO3_04845 [Marinibacterium profundimaris]
MTAALSAPALQAAPAMPVYSHQRAHLFAVCAGRLAALALHQSSTRHAAAPESRRLQEEFDMLLDAVLPDARDQGVPDGQAVRWRSQGWSEIAGFLADQTYSFDARIADLARNAAAERIEECRALLLPTT